MSELTPALELEGPAGYPSSVYRKPAPMNWWSDDRPSSLLSKLTIGAAIIAGLSAAIEVDSRTASAHLGSILVIAIIGALIVSSWLWPVTMYLDGSAQDSYLDESLFLLAAAVLPARGVLVTFYAATALVQIARRHLGARSLFEIARTMLAVGIGLLVMEHLAPTSAPSFSRIAVAVVATTLFTLINTFMTAFIAPKNGSKEAITALAEGLRVRLFLFGAAVLFGVVGATAVAVNAWAVIPIAALFGVLRLTLISHLRTRQDRSRILGLFTAALEVSRGMSRSVVTSRLSDVASALLDCRVVVSHEPPKSGGVGVELAPTGDARWLNVDSDDHGARLDELDLLLLSELASIGSVALANAALYAEQEHEQEDLLAISFSVGVGVCAFTSEGRVRFANPAAEEILGWKAAELRELPEGIGQSALALLASPAIQSMRLGTTIRSQRATFCRSDGEFFPVEYTCSPIRSRGEIAGATVTFLDISERVKVGDQLEFHAFHDALTGLSNRRYFVERLQRALDPPADSRMIHAVLFADVDRFKSTNDSLGHRAGDQLLITVAERLRSIARASDTLARFGGDEFTLLLEDIDGPGAVEEIASRIVEAVREPIVLDSGQTVILNVSIGIALARPGSSPDDALHDADVAMYQAKQSGTSRYEFFDEDRHGSRTSALVELQVELEHALDNHELVTYYQPIVNTDTREIIGAEALVRWEHPRRGLLLPSDFIGLAEETGMIGRLGTQVLERACMQAAEWRDKTGTPLQVSVNLSARQFVAKGLVAQIAEIIYRTRITPSQLCLEITETTALQDIERSIGMLRDLKEVGIQLALDDFGTGYSSLNYLRRLPVDIVKLDRSFVQDLTVSSIGSAIVGSIIDLARTIGLRVTAEGVETWEECQRLEQIGCSSIQGHLFAPAMLAGELTQLLHTGIQHMAPEPRFTGMTSPLRLTAGSRAG
ncbi:MAG TPA: EAL domain-containing protein [Acidimicrobiales bacterium]|nr:EAL domain-containing protein [Acidimicrobiales bacterium]